MRDAALIVTNLKVFVCVRGSLLQHKALQRRSCSHKHTLHVRHPESITRVHLLKRPSLNIPTAGNSGSIRAALSSVSLDLFNVQFSAQLKHIPPLHTAQPRPQTLTLLDTGQPPCPAAVWLANDGVLRRFRCDVTCEGVRWAVVPSEARTAEAVKILQLLWNGTETHVKVWPQQEKLWYVLSTATLLWNYSSEI